MTEGSDIIQEIKEIWKEIIALWTVFEGLSSFIWMANFALFLDKIKHLAVENPYLWGIKVFQFLLPSIIGSLILSVLISLAYQWIKEKIFH